MILTGALLLGVLAAWLLLAAIETFRLGLAYGQALLYVPQGLPAPNSPEHTDAVVDAALPLLR